jgi:hypothetical protein
MQARDLGVRRGGFFIPNPQTFAHSLLLVDAVRVGDLPDYVPQQFSGASRFSGHAGECSFVKDDRDEHGHSGHHASGF